MPVRILDHTMEKSPHEHVQLKAPPAVSSKNVIPSRDDRGAATTNRECNAPLNATQKPVALQNGFYTPALKNEYATKGVAGSRAVKDSHIALPSCMTIRSEGPRHQRTQTPSATSRVVTTHPTVTLVDEKPHGVPRTSACTGRKSSNRITPTTIGSDELVVTNATPYKSTKVSDSVTVQRLVPTGVMKERVVHPKPPIQAANISGSVPITHHTPTDTLQRELVVRSQPPIQANVSGSVPITHPTPTETLQRELAVRSKTPIPAAKTSGSAPITSKHDVGDTSKARNNTVVDTRTPRAATRNNTSVPRSTPRDDNMKPTAKLSAGNQTKLTAHSENHTPVAPPANRTCVRTKPTMRNDNYNNKTRVYPVDHVVGVMETCMVNT